MLPDIRAVIAALVAAVGLLMAAFGVAATLRVAQQHQTISLQADLAARGRTVLPAGSEPRKNQGERAVLIIETPGPHVLAPVRSAERAPVENPEPAPPAPTIAVQTAALEPLVVPEPPRTAPQAEPAQIPAPTDAAQASTPVEPAQAPTPTETAQAATPTETAQTTPPAPTAPPAEPPIGGPLEPPRPQAETPRSSTKEWDARRAAAEKARKARAARIARERKAAQRAAQARRAKQPAANPSFGGTFGNINQVGGTFRQ